MYIVMCLYNNVARCSISLDLRVQIYGLKNKVHKFESLTYPIYTETFLQLWLISVCSLTIHFLSINFVISALTMGWSRRSFHSLSIWKQTTTPFSWLLFTGLCSSTKRVKKMLKTHQWLCIPSNFLCWCLREFKFLNRCFIRLFDDF